MAIFDVSGEWDSVQGGGIRIHFDIQQKGDTLSGKAFYLGGDRVRVNGSLDGKTQDNQFLVTVTWTDGTIGEYSGTFNISGRIIGITFRKASPGYQATWVTPDKVFSPLP